MEKYPHACMSGSAVYAVTVFCHVNPSRMSPFPSLLEFFVIGL